MSEQTLILLSGFIPGMLGFDMGTLRGGVISAKIQVDFEGRNLPLNVEKFSEI